MKRVILTTAIICGIVGAASAQTFSSFNDVTTFTGITITPGLGTAPFTVSLAANASMKYNGTTYGVDQILGVYALNANGDLSATAGTTPSGWSFVNHNSGPGGIAGYEGNSNSARINNGESKTFSFGSLGSGVTGIGYHLQFNCYTPFGQTAYVTAPVPEPASMAVLGLGIFGLIRRKRRS